MLLENIFRFAQIYFKTRNVENLLTQSWSLLQERPSPSWGAEVFAANRHAPKVSGGPEGIPHCTPILGIFASLRLRFVTIDIQPE